MRRGFTRVADRFVNDFPASRSMFIVTGNFTWFGTQIVFFVVLFEKFFNGRHSGRPEREITYKSCMERMKNV